jgi:hypothetical protein
MSPRPALTAWDARNRCSRLLHHPLIKQHVNGFIALRPIPGCRGAASCRPPRSWPLGRRSGRVPALPYPPPRWPQCIARRFGQAKALSLALARRRVATVTRWGFLAAQAATSTGRLPRRRDVGEHEGEDGTDVPADALAAERSVGLLPGGARPFVCPGCLPYKQRHDHTCFFSSRSSMSRYCRTRAKLHCSA